MNMGKRGSDGLRLIAVGYEAGQPVPFFEKAEAFWLYYYEDDRRIRRREMLSLYEKDIDKKIDKFRESLLDTLICRNFGPKAIAKLKAAGFHLYTFSGGSDAAVKALMNGELEEL